MKDPEQYKVSQRFTDILWKNGWKTSSLDDDCEIFKLGITLDYDVDCYALVDNTKKVSGEYGVYGIEVADPAGGTTPPIDWTRLEELLQAIECAEENLLVIGVPFISDYEFHGAGKEEKADKNTELRRKWGFAGTEED